MDKDQMNEMLQLNEKAKKMDRLGNDDAALEHYLEILEHYHPNLYANFERPAIILEKKHRYKEAIEICQRALELIEEEKISGDYDKCQKRITKLMEKLSPEELSQSTENHNGDKRKSTPIVIAVLFAVVVIAYLILNAQSQYDDVYLDMSELEQESELEGSIFEEENPEDEEDLPEITETMIDIAVKAATINLDVTQAHVAINGNTLGFAVFVLPGTSKSRSEELGEEMVKALGAAASATHLDILPPSPVSFGGLYIDYDVIVSVGTSTTDIIAKGTKTTSAKKINWRK